MNLHPIPSASRAWHGSPGHQLTWWYLPCPAQCPVISSVTLTSQYRGSCCGCSGGRGTTLSGAPRRLFPIGIAVFNSWPQACLTPMRPCRAVLLAAGGPRGCVGVCRPPRWRLSGCRCRVQTRCAAQRPGRIWLVSGLVGGGQRRLQHAGRAAERLAEPA